VLAFALAAVAEFEFNVALVFVLLVVHPAKASAVNIRPATSNAIMYFLLALSCDISLLL
jgi:hypothetical protein